MSWNNIIPVDALDVDALYAAPAPEKKLVPARPGSRWATGNRTKQKGIEQPKGFARGAKVK